MTRPVLIAASVVVLALHGFAAAAAAKPKAPIAGGANQRASVEGCIGQTLFDGFWRFKVTGITSADEPFAGLTIPAWAVTMEMRNARSQPSTPALFGVENPQLILEDGTVLDLSGGSRLAYGEQMQGKELPPGGSAHLKAYYRIENNTSKPAKLLLGVNSATDGPRGKGYPMADPSFRVRLNCTK